MGVKIHEGRHKDRQLPFRPAAAKGKLQPVDDCAGLVYKGVYVMTGGTVPV